MKQQNHRGLGIACLSVKNLNSIGFDLVDRCKWHDNVSLLPCG
jgi:hypothetical protein